VAKLKVFRWKARDILGRSVWKTAHGYTAQIGGKQVRRFDAAWSKEDALDALAKFTRDGEPKALPAMTFADAGAKYLLVKARKRSLKEDIRMVKHLESVFGAGTPARGFVSRAYRGVQGGTPRAEPLGGHGQPAARAPSVPAHPSEGRMGSPGQRPEDSS